MPDRQSADAARVDPPDGRDEIQLRRASAADGPALLELTRACPMQGDVALRIDRAPDFFTLSRCRGTGFTLVAEARSHIVGCASVSHRPAYVAGKRADMGYVGDIKVHPTYRRAGVGHRLLAELARIEEVREPALYVGTTAAGNVPVDALLLRFAKGRALPKLATFVSLQLLPLFRSRVDPTFQIAPAEVRDEEEMAKLLDVVHRQYTFGPVFRDGGLRELLERSPGMRLSDYLVARRGGRIVGVLGVWDQHDFKQTRVIRMPRHLRYVSALVGGGARLFDWPTLPVEGDSLRFRYARHAAHLPNQPGALAALLRHALNAVRRKREHFLLFTCAEGDPIARCAAGLPRTTYRYSLVAGTNHRYEEVDVKAITATLPFDDAALA